LPNGLHYEWTRKALSAGKHVLLEKPAANTAEETKAMFELAESKGLVLMEAFHYRCVSHIINIFVSHFYAIV
jgi:predicted dehydrogenase